MKRMSTLFKISLTTISLAVSSCPSLAQAQDYKDTCYKRVYDGTHLSENSKQSLGTVEIRISTFDTDPTESELHISALPSSEKYPNLMNKKFEGDLSLIKKSNDGSIYCSTQDGEAENATRGCVVVSKTKSGNSDAILVSPVTHLFDFRLSTKPDEQQKGYYNTSENLVLTHCPNQDEGSSECSEEREKLTLLPANKADKNYLLIKVDCQ